MHNLSYHGSNHFMLHFDDRKACNYAIYAIKGYKNMHTFDWTVQYIAGKTLRCTEARVEPASTACLWKPF